MRKANKKRNKVLDDSLLSPNSEQLKELVAETEGVLSKLYDTSANKRELACEALATLFSSDFFDINS